MPKTHDTDQLVLEEHGFELPSNLDTQEKLKALEDDQNAGFLPFSHLEKSQATEMLDYLGNPREYPAGLGNRLQEIFLRNRRDLGEAEARRAMFSLAYEYGDFAQNAQQQLSALERLVAELFTDHLNPTVTVMEDFPDGDPAIPAVVRYTDVLAVRSSRSLLTPYDPLKVAKDRSINANSEDELQHKKVGDRYTTGDVPGEVMQRIERFIHDTTVAEFRPLAVAATENERIRYKFWMDRLYDTKKHGAAWIIGKQLVGKLEKSHEE